MTGLAVKEIMQVDPPLLDSCRLDGDPPAIRPLPRRPPPRRVGSAAFGRRGRGLGRPVERPQTSRPKLPPQLSVHPAAAVPLTARPPPPAAAEEAAAEEAAEEAAPPAQPSRQPTPETEDAEQPEPRHRFSSGAVPHSALFERRQGFHDALAAAEQGPLTGSESRQLRAQLRKAKKQFADVLKTKRAVRERALADVADTKAGMPPSQPFGSDDEEDDTPAVRPGPKWEFALSLSTQRMRQSCESTPGFCAERLNECLDCVDALSRRCTDPLRGFFALLVREVKASVWLPAEARGLWQRLGRAPETFPDLSQVLASRVDGLQQREKALRALAEESEALVVRLQEQLEEHAVQSRESQRELEELKHENVKLLAKNKKQRSDLELLDNQLGDAQTALGKERERYYDLVRRRQQGPRDIKQIVNLSNKEMDRILCAPLPTGTIYLCASCDQHISKLSPTGRTPSIGQTPLLPQPPAPFPRAGTQPTEGAGTSDLFAESGADSLLQTHPAELLAPLQPVMSQQGSSVQGTPLPMVQQSEVLRPLLSITKSLQNTTESPACRSQGRTGLTNVLSFTDMGRSVAESWSYAGERYRTEADIDDP